MTEDINITKTEKQIIFDTKRSTHWQLLVIREKELLSSFDQLPRTNE